MAGNIRYPYTSFEPLLLTVSRRERPTGEYHGRMSHSNDMYICIPLKWLYGDG